MKTYGFEEHVTNMRKPTFMTSEYSRFDSTNQESLMTSILLHRLFFPMYLFISRENWLIGTRPQLFLNLYEKENKVRVFKVYKIVESKERKCGEECLMFPGVFVVTVLVSFCWFGYGVLTFQSEEKSSGFSCHW